MEQHFVEGFLLGVALSPACLGVCAPLLVPFFGAESRSHKDNVVEFSWFLIGRLIGYILMGALAGWLGAQIVSHTSLAQKISQISESNSMRMHGIGAAAGNLKGIANDLKTLVDRFRLS